MTKARISGRPSRVVLMPRRWHQVCASCASDGDKKARSPGRSRSSRKTIARGVPGDAGVTVVTIWRGFFSARRLRAHHAPGIPCALTLKGRTKMISRAKNSCAEIAESCHAVIARSDSDEAIHPSFFAAMDCFADARSDGAGHPPRVVPALGWAP